MPDNHTSHNGTVTGVITSLAELPPEAHLDAAALGALLGRCKKSVQRAVRRGELPPPIRFMGRHVWLVRTIRAHMATLQEVALRQAERRAQHLSRDPP